MALSWGYHCRTCNTSSECQVDDPRVLRQIYLDAEQKLDRVQAAGPSDLETAEIQPLLFLSRHYGHDLWVENEYAGLRLP